MKSVIITGPNQVEVQDIDKPTPGATDVLVKIKACGICGSDLFYIHRGGIPPHEDHTLLGHEPSAEVVEVGASVEGVAVGDHVVINPMANNDGIIGNGGLQGALSEYVLLTDAVAGKHFRVIPKEIPWEVAALNEPMAVAYHGVNRSGAGEGSKVVVFGAGPVGLGAAIGFKSKGAAHVVVVDVIPSRLEKALKVGVDAVINSAEEDVVARLKELHGAEPGFQGRGERPATDVAFDAAGVPVVIDTALQSLRHGGVLTVVAVHKKPVAIDLQEILTSEVDIRMAMGYPTEIFEVTDSIIEHWDKYQHIIGDLVPYAEVLRGLELAGTPGASDKVVITFE